MREAEAYLQANHSRDVPTDPLASRVGLGSRTFVRRFHAATGRAPAAYFQAVRVETALALDLFQHRPGGGHIEKNGYIYGYTSGACGMATYSVVEAKNGLPGLIDRALGGEEVIITRHGKPVVELKRTGASAPGRTAATYEWLKSRRDARPKVDITSVELLNQLYDEPDV